MCAASSKVFNRPSESPIALPISSFPVYHSKKTGRTSPRPTLHIHIHKFIRSKGYLGFVLVFCFSLPFLSLKYFAVGVFSFLLPNFARAPLHRRPLLGYCREGGGVRRPSHNGKFQGSAQSKQAQPVQPPLQVAVIFTQKLRKESTTDDDGQT